MKWSNLQQFAGNSETNNCIIWPFEFSSSCEKDETWNYSDCCLFSSLDWILRCDSSNRHLSPTGNSNMRTPPWYTNQCRCDCVHCPAGIAWKPIGEEEHDEYVCWNYVHMQIWKIFWSSMDIHIHMRTVYHSYNSSALGCYIFLSNDIWKHGNVVDFQVCWTWSLDQLDVSASLDPRPGWHFRRPSVEM